MNVRKVDEITYKDGRKIKTYYNSDLREYVVKWYNKDGVHMDASDYFTDDKEDALATARVDLDGIGQPFKLSLKMLDQAMKDYVDNSSVESDGFLEGLVVTEEAARGLFKDFYIYLEQCEELYKEDGA